MSTKKILSAVISIVMLLSCLAANAATLPPQESDAWTNLTDKQADELLKSQSESFIFFFYRDICPNSQSSISTLLNYAKKNNMSFCGLNVNDYPNWQTWSKYLAPGQFSIGFPFIIAYNAEESLLAAKDNILSVKQFEELLGKVNMLPGSGAVPNKANKPLFKDIDENSDYYEAVKQLASDGILSGYEDGTFKPDNSITRTEAAVIIVRAGGLEIKKSMKSVFSDVADDFWGKDYIMSASEAGIIKGMGDGVFAPKNNVTNIQIIKMIVCLMDMEQEANKNGGWPNGYAKVAYEKNIIDLETYSKITQGSYSSEPATRGQVSQWIYSACRALSGNDFKVGGKVYKLGMLASDLGRADEICSSTKGFTWYVYGTETYENFFAAGVDHGEVVALASSGPAFEYKGYRAGQTLSSSVDNPDEFLTDKNDENIIHGVFLMDDYYRNVELFSDEVLRGESKMNFHFTNGFRLYHKLPVFKWDILTAEAARLHSVDMANNNYFNHSSLDGRNMGDRMKEMGVKWTSCAENISAGRALGIEAYNDWVNSSGHRKNILSDYTYLGVGFGYNDSSTYQFYATQNFYSRISAFDTFFQ